MKAVNELKHLTIGLGLLGNMATAMANNPIVVQEEIAGGFENLTIPADGSNCDPSVVRKNLEALNGAGVLAPTNLTPTKAAGDHCYGPCPPQLEAALVEHCKKAEKLAEIVELL